ncbi:hypothetical protein [Amycolatopsis circi]|nr:hypothetical protein [Amycolatopsis circi]
MRRPANFRCTFVVSRSNAPAPALGKTSRASPIRWVAADLAAVIEQA